DLEHVAAVVSRHIVPRGLVIPPRDAVILVPLEGGKDAADPDSQDPGEIPDHELEPGLRLILGELEKVLPYPPDASGPEEIRRQVLGRSEQRSLEEGQSAAGG